MKVMAVTYGYRYHRAMNTRQKGEYAQLQAQLRAAERGYTVSRPTTDARYDLVVDNGRSLERVQVNYAEGESTNASNSVVVRLTRKTNSNGAKARVYKRGEVDGLLVYVPQVNKVAYLPIELFDGKHNLSLRLAPCKNNQTKGVVFIKDYIW